MRMLPASAMLAIAVGLAGCACYSHHGSVGETPDCGGSISVDYASDGTPSAHPNVCRVQGGTELSWQGPSGDSRPFTIQFVDGAPDSENGRATLTSGDINTRQSVTVRIKNVHATTNLKYGIAANGKQVDPHIIIIPN
jgi:hypothetical protein